MLSSALKFEQAATLSLLEFNDGNIILKARIWCFGGGENQDQTTKIYYRSLVLDFFFFFFEGRGRLNVQSIILVNIHQNL